MGRRATITDVAARAGVSRTTVSLVIADADRIPDATKLRVRAAMGELGYVYNRAARAARVGRSSLIGLLLTDIRNPFFADLTMGVERAASGLGLSVLQGYSHADPEVEARLARSMAEQMLDGLILLPTPSSVASRLMAEASSQPVVQLLRRVNGLESDFVGVDNVATGALMGEHLAERGIASALLVADYESVQFRDRRAGMVSALPGGVRPVLGGARVLADALADGVPESVVTYNDTHLLAVLHLLRDRGLAAGERVAVASFDNTHIAEDAAPGITSVDLHAGRLAEIAVERLRVRLAEPDTAPFETLVPAVLVARESTLGNAGGG